MQKIRTANNGFAKRRSQGSFRSRAGHSSFRSQGNRNRSGRSGIDINDFIQKSIKKAAEPTEKVAIKHVFTDFNLSPEIQRNLEKRGYRAPTPIQDQAIGPILEGSDLVGLANTGTGKTAAFLLPMLDKVFKNRNEKVLIIAPTRELAIQIESELREFSYGMRIYYATCVGGMPISRQIRDIKMKRPNFIIGTPGRINDLSKRGLIDFGSFNNVILDEVDRMLDMGFIDEIKYFLSKLPEKKQALYFSATMPPKIKYLIESFSDNPVVIQVKSQEVSANIEQVVVRVGHNLKMEKLKEILAESGSDRVLVFSETKRDVENLSTDLVRHGYKADSIHGDKRQSQRQKALDNFKNSRVNILVATDVAARGLDIKNVTHVINYTVPQTFEDYIHRIGRTGRGNSKGKAVTFVA